MHKTHRGKSKIYLIPENDIRNNIQCERPFASFGLDAK